jgi:hypothetical protein
MKLSGTAFMPKRHLFKQSVSSRKLQSPVLNKAGLVKAFLKTLGTKNEKSDKIIELKKSEKGYLRTRLALRNCKGSLSDDIIEERNNLI